MGSFPRIQNEGRGLCGLNFDWKKKKRKKIKTEKVGAWLAAKRTIKSGGIS